MDSTLKIFGDKTPEFAITEHQIHDIGRRLQIMRQQIADTINNNDNLPPGYPEALNNAYYRYLGISIFLGAILRNNLDDFIKDNENFVDALTKNAVKDIKS